MTFHVEVAGDPRPLLALARRRGLGVGVAFNPDTAVADAARAADGADLALCMSIHPGYSGQDFMPEALARIRELRTRVPDDVFVQVDGGVKHENVAAVHEAGADLLVVGSAIFEREDLPRAYLRLVRALA